MAASYSTADLRASLKETAPAWGQAEAVLETCRAGGRGTILMWVHARPPPLTFALEWPILNLRVAKTNGPSEMLRPKLPGKAFRRSADPCVLCLS
jgi:hypothetical protein